MGLKSSKTHLLFWKTLTYQLYFSKAKDVCYNLLGSIKNWEGFQFLLYLQTNKLAWHSFTGAGRRNKIPGSKTKDSLLLTATAVPSLSICATPLGSSSHRVTWRGPGDTCPCCARTERSPECRELESSTIVKKQICRSFALEDDMILITQQSKQTSPSALGKDLISIF